LAYRGKSLSGSRAAAFNIDDYGSGEYDEETGLYEFYDIPEGIDPTETKEELTWPGLLAHWHLIEADIHDCYGLNLSSGVLHSETGAWLRVRLMGLLSADTRLARAVGTAQPFGDRHHCHVQHRKG
jgi:hypothetical protein